MKMISSGLFALSLAAAPGLAAVRSASPVGFEVESQAVIAASPAATYAALVRIGDWWDSQHTYSGKASNLTLEPRAGGCFCEAIPDGNGSIEHGRILYAQPGSILRLQGGLGPLQAEAAIGTLTWTLKAVPGGTQVTQTYVVGGHIRGGVDKMAPIVDQVLTRQLQLLESHLAR